MPVQEAGELMATATKTMVVEIKVTTRVVATIKVTKEVAAAATEGVEVVATMVVEEAVVLPEAIVVASVEINMTSPQEYRTNTKIEVMKIWAAGELAVPAAAVAATTMTAIVATAPSLATKPSSSRTLVTEALVAVNQANIKTVDSLASNVVVNSSLCTSKRVTIMKHRDHLDLPSLPAQSLSLICPLTTMRRI